jgi:hypothetical protein
MTVEKALRDFGLLLQQDKSIPSVAGIIAGEPIRGSWWSHLKGRAIFAALDKLADDPRVLVTRLIGGKVTYVHERLWPALLAAAMHASRDGLSFEAKKLLAAIERDGSARATGDAARELQERLLVHAEEVHTESGRHAIELQTWKRWAGGRGITPLAIDEARAELERAAEQLGAKVTALPWRRRGKKPH